MTDKPTTTSGTALAFEPVGEPFTAADGGKWQAGLRCVEAPKPPPPPKITITAPEVALVDRSSARGGMAPEVRWLGFPVRHLTATLAIIVLCAAGGWWGWRVMVDERTGAIAVVRGETDARLLALQADANAKLAAQHAQLEALRAQLAAAQQAPPATGSGHVSPAPPPEILSGQFEVFVDEQRRRILLGKLATEAHRVEARALVAQRDAFHGESDWRIVDPWVGIAPPAPAPAPTPSGPPPGHVQITEAEYRALQACRAVLVKWLQPGSRTRLRLNEPELAEASSAVGR